MDDFMGATVDSSIGDPQVNLLDLDMDFEFMSAERRQQLMSPFPMQSDVPCQLQCNDAQMHGGPDDGVNDLAKTQPYHASPNGQARLGRDFQSFDVAPAPRLIKAHRRRRSPHRIYNTPYPRSDYYTPDYAQHFDRDAAHPRRDHYRHRIPSPEAIKHRSEAIFVSAMADLDVREERDYDKRGTDSYRAGGNKRRRDDEDNYAPRDDRRGPQRRRRDDPPRRRYEEPPFPKLRRLLLNIASSTKLPQDEAVEIATYLGEHFDDERLRSDFFDLLVQLIIEQPFKIPFVAAVAFYGNDVKPEITIEAMKRVGDRAQQALDAGEWKDFKLLLRFFACLQSLYQDDGIFSFLGQLFDKIVDLQSEDENDVVGIELVKIILLTIPYAVVAGGNRFHEQAQQLLKNTGIVAGNALPIESVIHSYVGEEDVKPMAYHSVIGLLQAQLTAEAESGFALACIPHFDPEAVRKSATKEEDEETLPAAPPTHAFPTFNVPSLINPGPRPLFPEAYFSLFADQEANTVPKTTDVASSLIRDAIVDTINQLDFNREMVAKFLVDVDCYWTIDAFAKRGTPLDKFKDQDGKIQYKSEDMIIDAIFSQLFKLPSAEHKLVYYHSVITQCCKVAPQAIAPSLGRAIRTIYKSLPVLDLELGYRFLDWFSHHLSNFEFRWRWTEWLEDLELTNLHPKKAFILAALDKEIRLSFAKRVRSTLPEPMHALIPERLDEDNSPDFKYDNQQTPYAAEGQALLHQLRKKAPAEEVQATINKIHEQAIEHGISEVLVPSTDAFVTAICRLGAKSLSHVLSCIERGKDRLLEISQNEVARRQIVASVVEYWKDQPGVAVRIIDILLNYTILAPMTVVQWVFGSHLGAGEALTESWVLEMVSNTVAKVTNRNRQIASARIQKGLPADQIEMVDATLAKDRDNARELFKYIEDSTRGVSEGSADTLMEKKTSGALSEEEAQLIQAWGRRWHQTFLRKAQVEESVVGEQAVEARIKLLAAEPDVEGADGAATNGEAQMSLA
ncbi:Nuclear cap-binding protein subunit 1 [Didymella glomerata]|uniref:Nuclear cap-binding protein subunit 1 n=1 Tax=Didymella glomerata TaxID=749621 RepID=A0A9W8WZ93_9PLEO|nr:Nuclear cap-binding protein subunit 1 [Didymella glomerata]